MVDPPVPPPKYVPPSTIDFPLPAEVDEEATLTGPPKETPSLSAAASAPIEESVPILQSFGDYELLGELGRGGMGVVYQAREKQSGRLIALKMMLGEKADLTRFIVEARSAAELTDPGIVSIHSWGEHEGHPFYTMDYVPGETLSRILERGPLPCDRAVRYMIGMARAVATAHAQGIVHRDLKPSNVIIDPNDQPRILDFGLAKRQFQLNPPRPAADDIADVLPADAPMPLSSPVTPRTQRGAILGTPAYMSPEQAKGKHELVGPATDVHALGVMFYEMLTGHAPFQASNVLETLLQVEERQPSPLCKSAAHAPAILETICNRCLCKDPKARYADASALADALETGWRQRIQARRFTRLTALSAGILVLLIACQVMIFPWLAGGREKIAGVSEALASRLGPMTADSLVVLGQMFGWFLIIVAPLLAFLATLTWFSAWVWHMRRAVLFLSGFWALTAIIWIGSQFLEATAWAGPAIYLSIIMTMAAATASLVRAGRPGARQKLAEPSSGGTEPFLQRLFAVRSKVQLTTDVRPGTLARVGLEDFEIGKVLHSWPNGQVCRARQKSLDRPVLVWIAEDRGSKIEDGGSSPSSDLAQSHEGAKALGDFASLRQDSAPPSSILDPRSSLMLGKVVRHPDVLTLHAVGVGKEGQFLVTEPAAAVPMPEWLLRREFQSAEATQLAIRLARILQAFHEQGTVHGRLSAEWILIRGELEPQLCPCGVASQSIQARQRDLTALGKLLQEWLPPRPRRWQRRAQADVYRVADAASQGKYVRAKSLADDLERADRTARIRWRVLWGNALVVVLALLPVLDWGVEQLLSTEESWLDSHLLLALAPSAVLLGYTFSRGQVQGRRLRLHHVDRSERQWSGALRGLVQVTMLVVPVGLLVGFGHRHEPGRYLGPGVGLLAGASLIGFWVLGVLIAGLVSAAELVYRSLRVDGQEGERAV
jgi:tRNA A-37 threonylcarbamoyl transferase component Bud32